MAPPASAPPAPSPDAQPDGRRRAPARRKKSLVFPRAAFSRLVRELGGDIKSHLLWKPTGIQALQEATEDLIHHRFQRAARIAKLCKVDTITPEHFNESAGGARGAPTLEG
jgi:histone H3/H4